MKRRVGSAVQSFHITTLRFYFALRCNLSTHFLDPTGILHEPLAYSGKSFILFFVVSDLMRQHLRFHGPYPLPLFSNVDSHDCYAEFICRLCRLRSMTTIPQLRRMPDAIVLQRLCALCVASGYVASSSEEEYKDSSHLLLSQEQRTSIQNAVTDAVLVHCCAQDNMTAVRDRIKCTRQKRYPARQPWKDKQSSFSRPSELTTVTLRKSWSTVSTSIDLKHVTLK